MTSVRKDMSAGENGLLVWITREHYAERCLCDVLEQIADGLPGPVDSALTTAAVASLRSCISRHLALEDNYLYPMLKERARPEDLIDDLMAQVSTEHLSDESLAYDTADQLEALERGQPDNAEMLGYMLRCLFVCRRRHIAWEDTIVLPLAIRRLSEDDLQTFSAAEFERSLGSHIAGVSDRRMDNPSICGRRNGK